MKKVALHNLGCKVNAYETEAMQELLEKHGYEIVPFQEGADVYIINTCTVTNMADRKSRQMPVSYTHLSPPCQCFYILMLYMMWNFASGYIVWTFGKKIKRNGWILTRYEQESLFS